MMRRVAAALVAATLAIAGCSEPERWETRGFDSKSECYEHHGWDGSFGELTDRKGQFEFWCD